MKVLMFYFSGTGNTWWVMNKIKEKFEENNFEVITHSIESHKLKDKKKIEEMIIQSDIVGFGYPIYGSDIPENFMAFINSLPKFENKQAFVFTTMLLFSGDGAIVAKRRLVKRGFKVKQAINIRMSNNIKLPYPIFKSLRIRNGEELDEIKQRALLKIEKLVNKIVNGKRWVQGADPMNIVGGLMQRVEMRMVDLSIYARNFFVDKETCTQCLQCIEMCPTSNIIFEECQFLWLDKCIVCLRCYNFCPEDAIQYKKATLNREKYTRYKGPGNGFSVEKLKK